MLKFGISSCPNDIFIFYPLLNQKIDLKGYKFQFIIEDVESLNNLCLQGKLPLSKVSIYAFYHLQRNYELLNAGGAVSEYGPVAVVKDRDKIDKLRELKIALPGKFTTASALMWFYWKENFRDKRFSLEFMPFNHIIHKLINEQVDIGVLIHEGRFVYSSYGLNLLEDLGDFWKKQTDTPVPLGCIVAKKKTFENKVLESIIRESIDYSKKNTDEVLNFVKKYAQELNQEVIMAHINTYVNDYSINLGERGLKSIKIFLQKISKEEVWNWNS